MKSELSPKARTDGRIVDAKHLTTGVGPTEAAAGQRCGTEEATRDQSSAERMIDKDGSPT